MNKLIVAHVDNAAPQALEQQIQGDSHAHH
jgi:hypothetical protein